MNGGDSGRRGLRVEDPRAAAILTDPARQRYLAPFLGRARSVTAAAAELGADPAAMLYRVGRMLTAGLLAVERIEPRRGRPVKLYQAVAEEFFVPRERYPAGTPDPVLEGLEARLHLLFVEGLVAATEEHLGGRGGWGVRVFRAEDGRLRTEAGPGPGSTYSALEPDAPALHHEWRLLRLDFAEAKALQRELHALLGRYSAGRGGQTYAVRVSLAPVRVR